MNQRIAQIPPIQPLGPLLDLPDWTIARRTWVTRGVQHHQFLVRHPSHWLFEYRCLDNGDCLDCYWGLAPHSKILINAVKDATQWLIHHEWPRMSGYQT